MLSRRYTAFLALTQDTADGWFDDHAASMGAALSFYASFPLAPPLLIVISVAGMAFGADAARGEILPELGSLLGPE